MSNFNDDALLSGQFALQKSDDLLNRVDGVVNRWPRLYKNSYGERLYKLLADMEDRIAKTTFTDKRGEKRGLITPGQHEEWVLLNIEIGRIIGGWLKQQAERKDDAKA